MYGVIVSKDCSVIKIVLGVIAFVDVRAEHENRSKAVSRELEKLGATVSRFLIS